MIHLALKLKGEAPTTWQGPAMLWLPGWPPSEEETPASIPGSAARPVDPRPDL